MEDKLQERWARQSAEAQQNQQAGAYWWVTGVCQGKRFLYGPEPSESAASNLGLEKAGVQFETFTTSGRDRAVAAQKLKAILLQRSKDLPESMKKLRRKAVYKNEQKNAGG